MQGLFDWAYNSLHWIRNSKNRRQNSLNTITTVTTITSTHIWNTKRLHFNCSIHICLHFNEQPFESRKTILMSPRSTLCVFCEFKGNWSSSSSILIFHSPFAPLFALSFLLLQSTAATKTSSDSISKVLT